MSNEFSEGMFFVSTLINPPVKSAGNSGVGDLTIIIFSICCPGIMSNENDLESASELGTALLFIHTLLYLCESPLATTNLLSIIDIPGILRITSEALLSCALLICCAETPLITNDDVFIASIMDTSELLLLTTETVTSFNPVALSSNATFNSVRFPFSTVTSVSIELYETNDILT